jgi:hypothetical protein
MQSVEAHRSGLCDLATTPSLAVAPTRRSRAPHATARASAKPSVGRHRTVRGPADTVEIRPGIGSPRVEYKPVPLSGALYPCLSPQKWSAKWSKRGLADGRRGYTADSDGTGSTCRRTNSSTGRRAPQYRCVRRSSSTNASTVAGVWCGHVTGRCDRSPSPSRPAASYRPSQRCTVRRSTPHWRPTSEIVRPSLRTAKTA